MKLSWKDVLNPDYNWYGSRDNFYHNIVKPSGYPYFLWNDLVYKVIPVYWYERTEFTINDIN